MKKNYIIKKLIIDAIAVAMFCIIGMFSITFGNNIKVSLQLLFVFIIGLTSIYNVYDCSVITLIYLIMGLFLPVYAGFNVGITPTFGYVISFIFTSVWIKIINIFFSEKIKINKFVSGLIACIVGLLFSYIIGTMFFSLYMNFEGGLWNLLLLIVIPYIPFDLLKIFIACFVSGRLNKIFVQIENNKEKNDEN